MANIVSWDPFNELSEMQNFMERLFDRGFSRPWRLLNGRAAVGYFPVDLYETDDEVVVEASLPGVKPEDVNLSVTGETLTLKAETEMEHKAKEPTYYQQERVHGMFQRALSLPTRVDPDKADARFADGVLTLRLPKVPEVRPKAIPVKAS